MHGIYTINLLVVLRGSVKFTVGVGDTIVLVVLGVAVDTTVIVLVLAIMVGVIVEVISVVS